MSFRIPLAAAAAAAVLVAQAVPAAAACTRLGFSVNDYGKDGPTKDAQALLDKYVAQWTAERGIKKYTARGFKLCRARPPVTCGANR